MIRILLNAGADVNGEARFRNTALKVAVYNQNIKLTKTLLELGANVNDKAGRSGRRSAMTPLQLAAILE